MTLTAAKTRVMDDSTDITAVPKTIDIIATYINGHFGVVSPSLLEKMFPSDRYIHVLIDVDGSRPDADARDWEDGDKGGDLRQWVIDHNKHAGKKNAVIYCNRSTIDEVRRLTGDQILGKDYWLWIATLDGSVYEGEGVIACQDKGAQQNHGNFDQSIVFDPDFWVPTSPADQSTSAHLAHLAHMAHLASIAHAAHLAHLDHLAHLARIGK